MKKYFGLEGIRYDKMKYLNKTFYILFQVKP